MPEQNEYELILNVKPVGVWWHMFKMLADRVAKLEAKVAVQQIQIEHYKAREWLWRKLGVLGS